jgi:hypothetical protein
LCCIRLDAEARLFHARRGNDDVVGKNKGGDGRRYSVDVAEFWTALFVGRVRALVWGVAVDLRFVFY